MIGYVLQLPDGKKCYLFLFNKSVYCADDDSSLEPRNPRMRDVDGKSI